MSRNRWVVALANLRHEENAARQLVEEEHDAARRRVLMQRHEERGALRIPTLDGWTSVAAPADDGGASRYGMSPVGTSGLAPNSAHSSRTDPQVAAGGRGTSFVEADSLLPTLASSPMETHHTAATAASTTSLPTVDASASTSAMAATTTSRFSIMRREVLGCGSFGVVYKGLDQERGESVAIKETRFDRANRRAIRVALEREFDMLRRLDHPNIVRVYAMKTLEDKAQIVMEWMPSGSVSDLVRGNGFRLCERVVRRYAADALRGLEYLHMQGVVHRDIKPANMLVSASGVVKLSDFGTCKMTISVGQAATTNSAVGTPYYLSPEACSGKFSFASDIWAIACTVVEVTSGAYPWSHLPLEMQQPVCLLYHIGGSHGDTADHHPRLPEHLSKALQQLLRRCFSHDPALRPSAAELLSDPYFQADDVPPDAEDMTSFDAAKQLNDESLGSGGFSREVSEVVEYADATTTRGASDTL
jgi:hypothetical protein